MNKLPCTQDKMISPGDRVRVFSLDSHMGDLVEVLFVNDREKTVSVRYRDGRMKKVAMLDCRRV